LFLFITVKTFSQHVVYGKITDEQNQPLAGANILWVELNKGTVSDQNGNYRFTNIPKGKVTLRYSFLGYANHIESVQITGDSIRKDITMKLSPIQSEEVVVSGGYVTSQHANAVKIEVLKLKSHDAIVSPNFMDMLSRVAGVDMISKGSGVSKPVIRGLGMDNILVLNNGSRYENYQYSNHHPLGIDEFGIEQVEVIKGPASLLYGSDAMGGVLNFIREKPAPAKTWQGDYTAQFFSNSWGFQNNFGIKASGDKFFGGMRFGQKSHADYMQGGGLYAPNTRFNEMSAKLFGGCIHSKGINKIFYEYSRHKIGLAEDEAIEQIDQRGRLPEIFYQQFNTHFAQSQNKWYLGDFKLELNGSFQNTELIHFAEKQVREIDMQLSTFQYETKLTLPSGEKSEYLIGIQGYTQLNKNIHDAEVILLPNAQTFNHSVFGLIKYTIAHRFIPQMGIRYDYKDLSTVSVGILSDSLYRPSVNKNYQSINGSAGFTYKILEDVLFRMNVASAFRTPNIAELTSYGQHELRFEVGNAQLKPQKSLEYDVSVHIHKENITFDIAGFFNDVNHYIYIQPLGDTTASGIYKYQYMQNDASLYGGETGLHFHPKSHSWLHLETMYSMVYGYKKNGEILPNIPAHKWSNDIRFMKGKCWLFNDAFVGTTVNYRFKQNRFATDETPTSDYWLIDLNLGGNVFIAKQLLNIAFGVNNLFDKKYIDHLSTLKEVGLLNPGRNIYLSLSLNLRSNK